MITNLIIEIMNQRHLEVCAELFGEILPHPHNDSDMLPGRGYLRLYGVAAHTLSDVLAHGGGTKFLEYFTPTPGGEYQGVAMPLLFWDERYVPNQVPTPYYLKEFEYVEHDPER